MKNTESLQLKKKNIKQFIQNLEDNSKKAKNLPRNKKSEKKESTKHDGFL